MADLPSTKQLQPSSHGFNVYHVYYTGRDIPCTTVASPYHMIYVETDPELSYGWIFSLVLDSETSYRYKTELGVKPVNNDQNSGFAKFMGTISLIKFDMVDAVLRETPARVAQSDRRYPMLSISWNWVLDVLQVLGDRNILDKFSSKFVMLRVEAIDSLPIPYIKQEEEKMDEETGFREAVVAGKWEVDEDGELTGNWKADEDGELVAKWDVDEGGELVDGEGGVFAGEIMGELDNSGIGSTDGSDYGDYLSGEKKQSPRILAMIDLLRGELFPELV